MTTDSAIILLKKENQLLRERLAIAEQWIGREIRQMQFRKEKEETQKTTKIGLMETEEDIIERSKKYF